VTFGVLMAVGMKMVCWGVILCLIIEVRRETQKIAAAADA